MTHHSPVGGPRRPARGHTAVTTHVWFIGPQNGSEGLYGRTAL